MQSTPMEAPPQPYSTTRSADRDENDRLQQVRNKRKIERGTKSDVEEHSGENKADFERSGSAFGISCADIK